MKVALIILAAGESRRYGSLKQLALIDGEKMLHRVVRQCLSPETYTTLVVIGAGDSVVRAAIEDLRADIVVNDHWQEGIASSVRTGIAYISTQYPDATHIAIVLGDQYKMTAGHLTRYCESAHDHPDHVIATAYDGRPGVPAIFPLRYRSQLMQLTGDTGAQMLLKTVEDIILLEVSEAGDDLDTAGG